MKKTVLLLLIVVSIALFADTSGTNYTLRSNLKTEVPVTGSRPLQGDLDCAGYNLIDANSIDVNDVNTPRLSNLTGNGFIKTSGSNGTLVTDANTYYKSGDNPTFAGITSTADINSVGYSANGTVGIDKIIYVVDGNSTLHTLTFTKGLLTGVSP
jgi:hypothetical protein